MLTKFCRRIRHTCYLQQFYKPLVCQGWRSNQQPPYHWAVQTDRNFDCWWVIALEWWNFQHLKLSVLQKTTTTTSASSFCVIQVTALSSYTVLGFLCFFSSKSSDFSLFRIPVHPLPFPTKPCTRGGGVKLYSNDTLSFKMHIFPTVD